MFRVIALGVLPKGAASCLCLIDKSVITVPPQPEYLPSRALTHPEQECFLLFVFIIVVTSTCVVATEAAHAVVTDAVRALTQPSRARHKVGRDDKN